MEIGANGQEVSLREWIRRKEFVGFSDQDVENLRGLKPIAERYADEVLDQLYEHFMRFEETRKFFLDESRLTRVKSLQRAYFLGLTAGDYGEEYLASRLHIGRVHQRIGLEPRWYLGAYYIYMRLVYPRILEAMKGDPERAHQTILSLLKLFTLDQELATTTYAVAREEVINVQAEEILAISTPVVEIWDGVLAVPLIGTLDTQRAKMFMEHLLEGVVQRQSEIALVDITAVPTMDTRTAQHLIEAIGAVRLLGAQLVLTGVKPAIAQTLVHLGLDLSGVVTRSSLSSGLRYALGRLGVEVVKKDISHRARA
ncbi:MAG: STAS domain-containing protein [Myxococcales bacterium]|nr:STAS domain-containing protein [Myxococcales bacterium]